jgi:single-stranded-DNA-specific exonuclease
MGLALAQRLELPEIVGRVMAGRGVTLDTADRYLNPTLRALLPDPSHLRDMDKAAARLARAVETGERIAVFGDYDVDGATSGALLHRFLAAAGAPPRLYIPDRMAEGYGPNAPALRRLAAEGVKVVVTVDCGITAFEPLDAARDAGLDVIVVDHHVAEPRLPAAHAVVNPNRLDETSPLKQLAAVGVAFLLAIATNRVLREKGWFGAARPAPDLMAWLDVVALGTVCDVVPLTGLNRAFVTQGLKIMARRQSVGLAALADVARLDEAPAAYHAGFVLGPRVNAGGRVGEADLGVRLLTTEDPAEAATLAKRLDALNRERQALEAKALEGALAQAMDETGPLILASAEHWHPGVIGIVASRLVERCNRPAAVVALAGAEGKGSARSVPGVDMGAAIIAARQAGHLINGGGHPMAAGFTVSAGKLADLRAFLAERIGAEIARHKVAPSLALDGALGLGAATPELAERLERLAPFGVGNAEPCFAVADVRVVQSSVVGEGHVRAILADKSGARLKAIAFRAADQPLGKALLDKAGASLHVAGRLRPDNWQGRSEAQLVIADAAWAR